jgi:hypothetical protein
VGAAGSASGQQDLSYAARDREGSLKHWLLCSVLVALTTGLVAQQQLPPPFPRTNAKQLFENDGIRVWDIVWPQGQPTALHRHIYDQVGTYFIAGGRKITQPDGEIRTNFTEVGSLSTTKKGTTHIEEGTTEPPLRAVFIELKRDGPSGSPPADIGGPAPFPRSGAKSLLDDDRVSVWDATWQAGSQGFRYRPAAETVIVFLGEGTLRVTPARGAASTVAVKPGTMRHLDRGDTDSIEIASGSVRTIFFQFK